MVSTVRNQNIREHMKIFLGYVKLYTHLTKNIFTDQREKNSL